MKIDLSGGSFQFFSVAMVYGAWLLQSANGVPMSSIHQFDTSNTNEVKHDVQINEPAMDEKTIRIHISKINI